MLIKCYCSCEEFFFKMFMYFCFTLYLMLCFMLMFLMQVRESMIEDMHEFEKVRWEQRRQSRVCRLREVDISVCCFICHGCCFIDSHVCVVLFVWVCHGSEHTDHVCGLRQSRVVLFEWVCHGFVSPISLYIASDTNEFSSFWFLTVLSILF